MSTPSQDNSPSVISIKRRSFLRTAILLSTVSVTPSFTGCSQMGTPASGFRYLRDADLVMIRVLAPSVVGIQADQLDDPTWAEFSQRIDTSLAMFGPAVAKEYLDLFNLLEWMPTRILLTQQWSGWNDASSSDVGEFLMTWRTSSISALSKGYRALTALLQSNWYAFADHSMKIGYPGAPLAVRQALGIT